LRFKNIGKYYYASTWTKRDELVNVVPRGDNFVETGFNGVFKDAVETLKNHGIKNIVFH
jgi:hypothetical protein